MPATTSCTEATAPTCSRAAPAAISCKAAPATIAICSGRARSGLDTIRDAEGSNIAELVGFTGARLEGVVVGHDLIVVADYAPIFKVENYVGNEASFAGMQVDDSFVSTEELFS